jgi:hypothetical protein
LEKSARALHQKYEKAPIIALAHRFKKEGIIEQKTAA